MKAIVTGSTKGIGKGVVSLLAREGWSVALSSRNKSDLQAQQADLKHQFPDQDFPWHVVDFSQKAETIAYGQAIIEKWPDVHLLVNNAGIFLPGAVHNEPDGVLESQIQVNLLGPYHLTRAVLPAMMKRKKGLIINIGSIASLIAYPNGGAYTISKFALLGFSKCLREEMKPHGIKVTTVFPGSTWSASWEGADFPHERLMVPEDVAEAIVSVTRLSDASVVEEILIRPQLGDLP